MLLFLRPKEQSQEHLSEILLLEVANLSACCSVRLCNPVVAADICEILRLTGEFGALNCVGLFGGGIVEAITGVVTVVLMDENLLFTVLFYIATAVTRVVFCICKVKREVRQLPHVFCTISFCQQSYADNMSVIVYVYNHL